MTEKKIARRTCVGCREEKDKRELIRIVRTPEGKYHADPSGKAQGRGAYLCKSAECLEKAFKSEAFSRSFREHMPKEVKDALRAEVNGLV